MRDAKIAVIIPFFQRNAGILARAVRSVLRQDARYVAAIHVFIIDDGSPVSPSADLAILKEPDNVSWSVHVQPNGGPGAARNFGLELAEEGNFDFIAFLDSDDYWREGHLSHALRALDAGYDFFFCDNAREEHHASYSQTVVVLADNGAALREHATVISENGPVLGFAPSVLASEMVSNALCHTSAVVATTQTLRGYRFDPDLRTAGEDLLFWLSVALDRSAIAISWACNVVCGSGVNIYFSAFDWNAPATLERVGHNWLMFEKLSRRLGNDHKASGAVGENLLKYRDAYGFLFIRTILRGKVPTIKCMKKLLQFDPYLPLRLPFSFVRVATDRRPGARTW